MNGNGYHGSDSDTKRARKKKLKLKKRKKRAKWEKQLDPRHLLCHGCSSAVSQALSVVFILLIAVWICLQVTAFYQLSGMKIDQPMFEKAGRIMDQVKKKAIRGGMEISRALKIAPSEDYHVSLIDMRDLAATLPFDNPDGGAWKQGWEVQPVIPSKANPVKIFVVPHSHCDPGWIKTFDDYFQSQTKQILSTVVDALSKDPKRKFIWAEISYFEWWWREQTQQTQQLTRQLLENGQLEFVTGGWVQPDEANTQLYAMEIQLQEGHDWIRSTFGERFIPKYGWSIDPFGYSPTMAYLLKKYGFKAMLIQRVHYAVKKELAKRQHLEFKWRQVWDNEGEYDIFCHVMPFFSYDVPHTCGPDPSVCCQFDFARIGKVGCPWHKNPITVRATNVRERSMLLLDQYLKKASLYRSNVVIAPLGDDFRYQTSVEAENQYTNYQKMFDYINNNVEGVEIQFGTLSEYFQAAMDKFDPPLLKGSFFTYSDVNEDYWSGYYTSRVFDKSLDRLLEKSLYSATSLGATNTEMQAPRRALSLFQHHDGVTGTAKDHVVQDYAKRIFDAIHTTQDWVGRKITELKQIDTQGKELLPCWRSQEPRGLHLSMCDPKDPVWIYNPLEIPQTCGIVEIAGREVVEANLPCEIPGPIPVLNTDIRFDPKTGLMTHPIREEWMTWHDKGGGAYLFKPERLDPFATSGRIQIQENGFSISSSDERGTWKRMVVEKKAPSQFGGEAKVIDFIYETDLKSDNQEWLVRFTGSVNNNGVFHTDLNGFNFDTHYFRKDMPLQSQVFPMPTLASIEDIQHRMTILSNHAQGTASLQDSSIDVWLDRRLTTDDARGLGQGVTDNVPTRTRLRVILEPKPESPDDEFHITPLCSQMWEELNHPLEIFGLGDGQQVGGKENPPEEAAAVQPNLMGRMWDVLHQFQNPPEAKPEAHQHLRAVPTNSRKEGDDNRRTVVPFVYMVYKRVDFFKKAIASLLESDFPKEEVPLIVSHDGHFADFSAYVESLKDQGFKVIELFHPFACADHPDTFPGDDPKLNEGYKGDAYGNPRSAWVTCCKHHFTWLMKTVYALDLGSVRAESFLFMEEDYVVAPTVYSAIQSGLDLIENGEDQPANGYFGLVLDTSDGFTKPYDDRAREVWTVRKFVTGPMVLLRSMFDRIRDNAHEYCTFDDYNWYVCFVEYAVSSVWLDLIWF